jgi:uncharacterized repeat protein (TIGR01451 family)
MKIRLVTPRTLLAASCALGLITSLPGRSHAAATPPPPSVSLDVKMQETTVAKAASTGKKSKGSSSLTAGNTNHSATYTITVRNNGSAPIAGLTISYTIYTQTLKTTPKSSGTTSYKDTTDSASTDIAANSSTDVKTKAVTTEFVQAYNKNGTLTSTTREELVGIHIEAKLNDAVLATCEDPLNIKATMDARKTASGKSTGKGSSDSTDN